MQLVYDHLLSDKVGYPNLAQHRARPFTTEWRQFDNHWPWVVPLRLTMYLDHLGIDYRCRQVVESTSGWYPVAFSWFDFDIDYFELMPEHTRHCVKEKKFKILFYYHEGDNPARIEKRLQESAERHCLPKDCFVFVSANTVADCHFSEHECFFAYVNRNQYADIDYLEPSKDFTLLNRQHKWWRASVVADLHRDGLLENSLWSYDTQNPAQDLPEDNPVSIYTLPGLPAYMESFISAGPYRCDDLDRKQQNDHHWVNVNLYGQSFFHIVVETHFDADQSGGTFLTEKTWKCIKYGQPFVIVGPAGSLQHLRDLGYRVFDDVLDNNYDTIIDPTERWCAIKKLLAEIKRQGAKELWVSCRDDITWNKEFFSSRPLIAVNNLLERLECQK